MIVRPFVCSILIVCMAHASLWTETTQEDFADGIFERNIYASHLDGGAVEFAPRFDLNNDGYIDLFTADRHGPYVKLYWGSASGYSPGSLTQFPSSGSGNCDAADVDNDGYADFIVTHKYTPKLTVYWGSPTGPGPYGYSDIMLLQAEGEACFVADFNKDGYLDIAMDVTLPGYGSVFWGSASGFNFSNRIDLPVEMGQHNIEVADFNKDNWLDVLFVAATWPTETYRIYWGASTGFSPTNFTSFPAIWGSHGVTVADLNCDAFLDIVYTYWYDPAAHIYWGDSTGYSGSNMQVLNPGYCYGGSAAADINKDGYLDIVFHRGGYGKHQQEIYWGSAAGYHDTSISYIGIPIEASGGLVADFDNDGDLDIFSNAITPGSHSYVFWGSEFTTYTELPVNNDHHGMFREIGNVYDRNYNEPYISSVFDAGQTSDWGTVEWDDSLPSGASIECCVRTGNTPSYDPTWSDWCMLGNGEPVPDSLNSQYIQYMTSLIYTNPALLPCLYEMSISYNIGDYIIVTVPNGGECWIRGNAYDITWTSNGVSGDVKIELYKGGVFNSTIVSSTANSGSYNWVIPAGQLPGTDYQVKIISINDPAVFDHSDADFTICSQIIVTAPNGGETWHIGETYDITWAPAGIGGNVSIEYSTDAGSTWNTVTSDTLDNGSYPWTIPATPTTQGRVKATHLTCAANYDESDGDFAITEYGITVTSPNGGEGWIRGNSYEITWMSSGVSGDVKIELYKGGVFNSTIVSSTANSGSYSWNIPAGQLPGTDYQVKITSISDPAVFDQSDADFTVCSQIVVTAPNGGETWHIGESHDITWAPAGIDGNVAVEYSTNGGSSWLIIDSDTPDDGIHTWSVPNTPTTEGRVKVTYLAFSANYDESDGDFTIPPLAIEENQSAGRPTVFSIQQNCPNPSSSRTLIKYAIPEPCRVEIRLYDVTGQEIAVLMDENLSYGYYGISIDVDDIAGRRLANGVYFYRFMAGQYIETKSLMVAR
ncbi:hypothetical protein AMJ83_02905 [candidate division WOR_3 bacterium SM23_42]|uniref:Yeast cell wall synthesis Kre9/Knh1-like N-terminal domain-containing protein n=1 Tax=candidate division WOR_3 bacterium SM23_42 TaxID=1703779 RepID=A0A0S8FWS7_UNCW3|nr:MAG: hypothetical protein AMJ83_02905 [candidate division WOR_3 bacterium SM23_42]